MQQPTISDLQSEKLALLKERAAKLSRANDRNGLFGDTETPVIPNLFRDLGEAFNPAAILQVINQIDQRIASIDQTINNLNAIKATAQRENAGQAILFV